MKKSQMEIMGLVIIVILVSLAVLFVVQFIFLKESGTLKKTYTHTQLAANTLNAITKTTARSCKNQDLTQLLQDCAAYNVQGGIIICDDGRRSCDYANDAIGEILSKTLNAWNKEYSLIASIGSTDIVDYTTENCAPERKDIEKQTKIYPIPVPGQSQPMTLRLDICN